MTTLLRLKFMGAETPLARLYQDEQGREQWVPKSVCHHTRKWPSQEGQPAVHEVTIEDWWLQKNPFTAAQRVGQGELL